MAQVGSDVQLTSPDSGDVLAVERATSDADDSRESYNEDDPRTVSQAPLLSTTLSRADFATARHARSHSSVTALNEEDTKTRSLKFTQCDEYLKLNRFLNFWTNRPVLFQIVWDQTFHNVSYMVDRPGKKPKRIFVSKAGFEVVDHDPHADSTVGDNVSEHLRHLFRELLIFMIMCGSIEDLPDEEKLQELQDFFVQSFMDGFYFIKSNVATRMDFLKIMSFSLAMEVVRRRETRRLNVAQDHRFDVNATLRLILEPERNENIANILFDNQEKRLESATNKDNGDENFKPHIQPLSLLSVSDTIKLGRMMGHVITAGPRYLGVVPLVRYYGNATLDLLDDGVLTLSERCTICCNKFECIWVCCYYSSSDVKTCRDFWNVALYEETIYYFTMQIERNENPILHWWLKFPGRLTLFWSFLQTVAVALTICMSAITTFILRAFTITRHTDNRLFYLLFGLAVFAEVTCLMMIFAQIFNDIFLLLTHAWSPAFGWEKRVVCICCRHNAYLEVGWFIRTALFLLIMMGATTATIVSRNNPDFKLSKVSAVTAQWQYFTEGCMIAGCVMVLLFIFYLMVSTVYSMILWVYNAQDWTETKRRVGVILRVNPTESRGVCRNQTIPRWLLVLWLIFCPVYCVVVFAYIPPEVQSPASSTMLLAVPLFGYWVWIAQAWRARHTSAAAFDTSEQVRQDREAIQNEAAEEAGRAYDPAEVAKSVDLRVNTLRGVKGIADDSASEDFTDSDISDDEMKQEVQMMKMEALTSQELVGVKMTSVSPSDIVLDEKEMDLDRVRGGSDDMLAELLHAGAGNGPQTQRLLRDVTKPMLTAGVNDDCQNCSGFVKRTRPCFVMCCGLFFFVALLGITLGTLAQSSGKKVQHDPYPYRSSSHGAYPICDTSHFQSSFGIGDVVLMSLLGYDHVIPGPDAVQAVLDAVHPGFWHMKEYVNNTNPLHIWLTHNVSANTTVNVVVVRGTLRLEDMLADLELFWNIFIMQSISHFIPILRLWPDLLSMRFIEVSSQFQAWLDPSAALGYYATIQNYVENTVLPVASVNKELIFIVGHSLGGGIAHVVAARVRQGKNYEEISSLGVSAPGVYYSSLKFGVDVQYLDRVAFNVWAHRDIVPQIDRQTGVDSALECAGIRSVRECHSVETTLCELRYACGSHAFAPFVNLTFIDCLCNMTAVKCLGI